MKPEKDIEPPKIWMRFLRWFCREDLLEDVEGDLLELFYAEAEHSPKAAKKMVSREVVRLVRPRLIRAFKSQTQIYMYSNFLKVAYRNARNYKGYTALNLLGLVLGITTSMLIYLWVEDETSKDKFHENGETVFSVRRNMQQSDGVIITTPNIPHPFTDLVKSTYPEVQDVCEISWPIGYHFENNEIVTVEEGRVVSPNFFETFSFDLLEGDRKSVLSDPSSILLSEKLAMKYLSDDQSDFTDLIGKTLHIEDQFDFVVSGIFKNPGSASSLQFDWLISSEFYVKRNKWMDSWGNGAFSVHLLLKDASTAGVVAKKIGSEIEDHTEETTGETLWLQKYEDSYLYDNYENGKVADGRITYVRIMQIVWVFIVLIACINYMNLTTARSSRRLKEIGVRRAMGALRNMLAKQFYVEALLYAAVAVGFSLLLVFILLPYYNQLVNKQLEMDLLHPDRIIQLLLLVLAIGLFAGSYPAIRLSNLALSVAMKGSKPKDGNTILIRKGLVVLQVGLSFCLLFGAMAISEQVQYLLKKDTGIARENIVAVWLEGKPSEDFETFKNELLTIPGVSGVTGASGNPVRYGRSTSSAKWEGQEEGIPYELNIMVTSDNYFENLSLEILQGRSFNNQLYADSNNFVINESARAVMGFNDEDPIGKKMSVWGLEGEIVGVVKDYHTRSLHSEIPPLILMNYPTGFEVALVNIDGNSQKVLMKIEEILKVFNPKVIFDFEFLDQAYQEQYDTERTIGKLSIVFVIISVVIAVLGLLGLSAYSTEKRAKEISIRKIHGASVMSLLVLLCKEYAALLLIAFVLAMPIGYWFLTGWLEGFAYHISLDANLFIFSGLLLFAITLATVGIKSFQVTQKNPSQTLRSE